jgi:hypothetical protein
MGQFGIKLDTDMQIYLGLAAFVVLLACALWFRSYRIRMGARVRRARAENSMERKLSLPPGVRLNSKKPLFEVLYENLNADPKLFASHNDLHESLFAKVGEVLQESRANAKAMSQEVASLPSASLPALTEEEQIGQLVSVQINPAALPMEALATRFLVHFMSVLKGKKNIADGVQHAVLDSLTPGGGFAGAKLGSVVGLSVVPLLGPVVAGVATFALPVFMLAGAYLGSMAGKKIGDRVKARKVYAAIRKLTLASKEFRKSFLIQFPLLMKQLDEEYETRIKFTHLLLRNAQMALIRFFVPNLMTVFLNQALIRLVEDWDGNRKEWKLIKKKVRVMPPLEVAHVLYTLTERAFMPFPKLHEQYQAYDNAVRELREAQAITV